MMLLADCQCICKCWKSYLDEAPGFQDVVEEQCRQRPSHCLLNLSPTGPVCFLAILAEGEGGELNKMQKKKDDDLKTCIAQIEYLKGLYWGHHEIQQEGICPSFRD